MQKGITMVLLLLLGVSLTFAQSNEEQEKQKVPLEHRLGLYGKVGYAAMFDNLSDAKTIGGYGLGIGFGYELRRRHLLFDTGLEFDWLNSTSKIGDFRLSRQMTAPYPTMTYNYVFSDYREARNMGQLAIPLMLGGQWNKFYFLAGVNLGYGLAGNYRSKANLTISADDSEFVDPLTGMPNHMLDDRRLSEKGSLKWNFNTAVAAEFGIDLDEWLAYKPKSRFRRGNRNRKKSFKECLHYRASIFAEYGVLNVNNYSKNEIASAALINFPDESTEAKVAGSSLGLNNAAAHPFFVGAKFTIQYEVQPPVKKKKKPQARPQQKPQQKPKTPVQPRPKPEPQYYLCGIVRDAETGKVLDASVELFTQDGAERLYGGNATEQGIFSTKLRPGTYGTYVTKQGYLPYSESIAFVKDTVIISLQAVKQGTKVVLHNLYFATNKTRILPESEQALEDLAQFLKDNPEVRIRITGHTDDVGKDEANMILSEGRAKSVHDNLIERGIDDSRLEYEGKGESEPIADNSTDEGRQQNRRVEFTIL